MTSEKLEQIRSRLSTLDAIPTIPVVIQPLLAMLQTPIDDVDLKKSRGTDLLRQYDCRALSARGQLATVRAAHGGDGF